MLDAELAHEREYVAGLYARLEELREEKRRQLAQVRRAGAVGTMQNVSERDAFAALYEDRLAQLDAVDDRLVFGRLDLDSGDAQYIGRIGLTTEDLQRLMVDWRAPEAGHFYQATAFDRQGVRRRRHLILQGREVKAIEDDVLDASMLSDDESLQGEGALLAALNSKRTGRMSDIVSTIQSEQDRIIRSSISGALVVQGGPGTGKTAVALHRAAYLLYTHRDRLKSAGVLLVGPSSSFMKYIERVLPSLGETGVVMASLGRLMPGIQAVPETDPDVAAIKGRLDMAEIVANAVSNRQRIPEANRILEVDGRKLTLTPRQVRRARERARSTGKPHNEARVTFVKILLRELTEQLTEKIEADNIGNNADRSYLAEDVRTARDVRIALNLCWMPMTPEKLISELFSKPAILEFCTPNLTPAQRALLQRPADAPWTEADVPLLDEAAELLGELDPAAGRGLAQQEHDRARDLANAKQTLVNMQAAGVDPLMSAEELAEQNREQEARQTAAERATSDRTWAFGHIVVDEAQELSPMQWRLLVRRCPLKSFTIVGDIAQTSSVAGANSWQGALAPMFGDRWQLEELTVNYRTPSQIAEAAVRMANAAGLVVSAPKAVREGRWSPVIDEVDDGAVVSRLLEVLPEELEALDGGLLAVIADGDLLPAAASALRKAYGHRVGSGAGSYEQDIVVISPREAKGLEFDGVVVLEPSTMLNHEHGKVGDLYVAMTRPTQRLRLIAAQPVPAGIVR
ncbi:DNA helicase IV [Pseudarthrobacter enclensis]|uniref:AAA family ATPase n=1 Tax=Pseudarthrobacter enclensis TaxID=993070 RepID=A0A0V8IDG1_9MICC|nr:AAA family ATPase [Pseudarthrobacter enclensis]KSU72822.1 AAA family ATPase [Pseudarthrobacter enclensis]SCC24418.1 DNA helicase IV [Pseudarthrobacter enclensis]